MSELRALYRCQGCGAWLIANELDDEDGHAVAAYYPDPNGDPVPMLCGPVEWVGPSAESDEGAES